MVDPSNDSAVFHDILDLIQFTETVAIKIYGLTEELDILQGVLKEFRINKKYSATITLFTSDATKLRILGSSLPRNKLREGEKTVKTRLKEFTIDLAKSSYYHHVVKNGETIPVQASNILRELFPRPLVPLIVHALGLKKGTSVLTPLRKKGNIIGALAVSSLGHEDLLVPHVRNLAAHISHALDLAFENHQRSEIENSLQESVQRFQDIAQSSIDCIFSLDAQGNFNYASPAVIHIMGYHPSEVVGQPLINLISSSSSHRTSQVFAQLLDGKAIRSVSLEIIKKDDSMGLIEITASPIIQKHKIVGVQGIIRDITNQKSILSQLGKAEQQYQAVVENIGVGVSLISPAMEILALNAQMRKWFPHIDVTQKPLCYKNFNNPPRDEVCTYCPTYKTLRDGKVHEAITETPHGDHIINYRIVSSPIKDETGAIIAAIEMVEDITERKKMEERLAEQDKMAALGRVASVVSHELNTPLANIALATEYLSNQLRGHYHKDLVDIKNEVTHASNIIQRLLGFSRMEEIQLSPLDLFPLLIQIVTNTQKFGYNIPLTISNKISSPLIVRGDRYRLLEAFTNILKNAIEAHDPKKKNCHITIESQQNDDTLSVIIADNGIGMSQETLQKAIKPFFTTKAPEEGTGLGLFFTQWVMKQHGGQLIFSSKPHKGTTVTMTFPRYHPP